jgi:hypothetical protein
VFEDFIQMNLDVPTRWRPYLGWAPGTWSLVGGGCLSWPRRGRRQSPGPCWRCAPPSPGPPTPPAQPGPADSLQVGRQAGSPLYDFYIPTVKILYGNLKQIFPEKELRAASVPILTFMFLCAIYIFPRSVCLFCCRKIGVPIVGIYKSLTETWMWILGLRPCSSSCSGNTKIEISLQCLFIYWKQKK